MNTSNIKLQSVIYNDSRYHEDFYIVYDENYNPLDIVFTNYPVSDEVIHISEITDYSDFVYDLETEDGTFQAGIGNIIVSNTDSVFVHYKNARDCDLQNPEEKGELLKSCFELGEIMANDTSRLFNKPILLEFEKIYFPFISFGKKTYSGICYEPPNYTKYKLDNKGNVLTRRDNPNITKIAYQGILDIIMAEGKPGIQRALVFLNDTIKSIFSKELNISDFVVSKTYKTNYKSENIPHKILAERMKKRDPGNAPAVNERVPYVFIENNSTKQFEKVEHPDYVIQNNLKLDGSYYVDQIKNPVAQILKTFMYDKEINDIFNYHKKNNKTKNYYQTNFIAVKSEQRKITEFCKTIKK